MAALKECLHESKKGIQYLMEDKKNETMDCLKKIEAICTKSVDSSVARASKTARLGSGFPRIDRLYGIFPQKRKGCISTLSVVVQEIVKSKIDKKHCTVWARFAQPGGTARRVEGYALLGLTENHNKFKEHLRRKYPQLSRKHGSLMTVKGGNHKIYFVECILADDPELVPGNPYQKLSDEQLQAQNADENAMDGEGNGIGDNENRQDESEDDENEDDDEIEEDDDTDVYYD